MRIVHGDIWHYYERGAWAVIPTNTCVRADGTAVMGAGLAKQAAERFPELPALYGEWLNGGTNDGPVFFDEGRLILFPTKRNWRNPSDLDLIEANLSRLAEELSAASCHVVFPLLGCGLGGLDWEREVRPLMERYLVSDRYAVVVPGSAPVAEMPQNGAGAVSRAAGTRGGVL